MDRNQVIRNGIKEAVHAPDWLPDPQRDLHRYPDPETDPPARYAWEFLRRNLDYQAIKAELDRRTEPYGTTCTNLALNHRYQLEQLEAMAYRDDRDPCIDIVLEHEAAAERFGVRLLIDPAEDFDTDHHRLFVADAITVVVGDGHNIRTKKGQLYLEIPDPNLPESWIIEAVKQALGQHQRRSTKTTRNREQEWRSYLRVLDAKTRGQTNSEIALWLLPEHNPKKWAELRPDMTDLDGCDIEQAADTIGEMLKKAEELTNGGYRNICAPRKPRKPRKS